jgi:hypothetical protein
VWTVLIESLPAAALVHGKHVLAQSRLDPGTSLRTTTVAADVDAQ